MFARIFFPTALLFFFGSLVFSQDSSVTGSLKITAKPKIGTKQEALDGKRFYLFNGGIDANKELIEKLKNSKPISRECFYCSLRVSPEYMAWLNTGNCDSVYCREITASDVGKVPEFKAAYQKSLTQYGNRPSLAQKWLITNLAPNLRNGFYSDRRRLLDTLLTGLKPVQSAVTDSVNFNALFVDIPLKESEVAETFLIANLIPVEVGGKSYIWACEVQVGSEETAALKLQVPENGKQIKNCEVIVKDLSVCDAASCTRK